MRDRNSRPLTDADAAIKSAGAARHNAKQHNLPVVVEVADRDEEGVQYVTYTCTHDGQTAQLKVRVDHTAGTASPVIDTGDHELVAEVKRQRAEAQKAKSAA